MLGEIKILRFKNQRSRRIFLPGQHRSSSGLSLVKSRCPYGSFLECEFGSEIVYLCGTALNCKHDSGGFEIVGGGNVQGVQEAPSSVFGIATLS